ncbi:polysaccharide biosynthesis/export family protein [Hymenobacter sp. HSC-4F20]|uniref:polysaccharide biosynthesis/export family protein n=1 Tax=Hymenobacter sp. HSC-4F20 TaxID=2864135 RepID=UPI001C734DCB|nr:polysaccharide biosynthesis/export family protein [Hymenobacter sp. HSC-4F20]MBX0291300.1 polysaccharide biosynthesis/export family protein [Hymenobacter sp. HSC-4F20]
MNRLAPSHLMRLWMLCIPLVLLTFSCTTSRVRQQNILFRTDGAGRLDTARLRDVVNRAERNYIIQPNDYLDVRVYTNKGERILDPNGELFFGSPGGNNAGGGGFSRQGTSGGQRQSNQQQRGGNTQQQQGYTEFMVQHDGMVKLPMVDYVRLAGLTLLEADSLLQIKYTVYYKDVFVTTRVTNNRIIVLGAAAGGAQVIQMFNDNMNLLEVLAQAGGISGGFVGPTAGNGQAGRADNIRLIRGSLKNPQVQVINLTTIDGMRRANLQVEPNDIIYVEPIRRPFYEALADASPLFAFLGGLSGLATLIIAISK